MAFFKTIWKNNSKHKKLSEELALQNSKEKESKSNSNEQQILENEDDVITFKLKYLGSTVVEKITGTGDNINTEAVKNIVKTAKATKGRKKLQRVDVAISLKGIAVTDQQGNDVLKISIYRISNCSADVTHRQIFSFISTDPDETMECHAFFCSKRKTAESVTLAVAHAFSTAYEAWREMPDRKQFHKSGPETKENEKNNLNQLKNEQVEKQTEDEAKQKAVVEDKLIDFDSDPLREDSSNSFKFDLNPYENNWVCFEDDFVTQASSSAPKAPYQVDLILA